MLAIIGTSLMLYSISNGNLYIVGLWLVVAELVKAFAIHMANKEMKSDIERLDQMAKDLEEAFQDKEIEEKTTKKKPSRIVLFDKPTKVNQDKELAKELERKLDLERSTEK